MVLEMLPKPYNLQRLSIGLGCAISVVFAGFVLHHLWNCLESRSATSHKFHCVLEFGRSFDALASNTSVEGCCVKQPLAVQTEENQSVESDELTGLFETQFVSPRCLPKIQLIDSSETIAENCSPPLLASNANQEMDRKLADADLSSAYAEEMIATWRDRTNHELVRNFAVQHLERYVRECVVRGTPPSFPTPQPPLPTASPPPRSAASSSSAPRFPPSAPSPPIPPPQRPSASPHSTRRMRSKAGERRLASAAQKAPRNPASQPPFSPKAKPKLLHKCCFCFP